MDKNIKILQRARGENKGNLHEICPTITSNSFQENNFLAETPCIAASRGRNQENPRDRTTGISTEQRLEINTQHTSNTITTISKDNLLIEKQAAKNRYRIRRLMPIETNRLMDFDDEDFKKCKAIGISDSQLYRQHGNSIVVSCLEGIFYNLLLCEKRTEKYIENEQISIF